MCFAHCCSQWGATNGNISTNTGFWYVPIRHIGRYLECQNVNSMSLPIVPQIKLVCSLSATLSSHISTNTRSFCDAFSDLWSHNKDKLWHWEDLKRGSLAKIKWNVPFSWHVNLSATCSISCSDLYHETENYTLISRAICFQTPWMTL